jgi:fucose permease
MGMQQAIARVGAIRTLDYSFNLMILGLVIWSLLPNQLWSLPLIGLGLGTIFPTVILLTPKRVPAALVPATIGFLTSSASLGAATIPTAVGWIASRINLGIIPVLMLPLAVLMIFLHRWLAQQTAT